MLIDAIIGQDFLCRYITKIDYKHLALCTDNTKIPCWLGGEYQMTCRVLVKASMDIPPLCETVIPIDVPQSEHLSQHGFIDSVTDKNDDKHYKLVEGVINNRNTEKFARVINYSQNPVTLHPNTVIGQCQSFYEQNPRTVDDESNTHEKSASDVPDHLSDLFSRCSASLSPEELVEFASLLRRYSSVFSQSPDDIGRTDLVQHRINTGMALPIRQPVRRLPFGKRDTEKAEIQKMLAKNVIEPSSSAWSSPIVLVTKKDGSIRFCVDYRRVNDVTVKDAYPIPNIIDCLDSLSKSKYFSSMDLNSGFWQIGMHPDDKDKTAFSTSQGLFQFSVMPFGLANSPSTFQRLMENIFRGLQWEECLVYMDDIIVPSATFNENIVRLEHILSRLKDANLKLKPSKCNFFQSEIKVLGHIVSSTGIHTDPEKIKAVQDWPRPTNQKQVKSFLGLCSYYRRFVKGFADIARPLHQICQKNKPFSWSEDCEKAFQHMKVAMTTPPILKYPIPGCDYILDTDASDKAVGAVLSQVQEGQEVVIAFYSKAMTRHEQAYCATRKELLAVISSIKNFHHYLYGQDILLRTDNSAVSWMKNLKNPTGQVARWLQELETYNLTVTHRPGRSTLMRTHCHVIPVTFVVVNKRAIWKKILKKSMLITIQTVGLLELLEVTTSMQLPDLKTNQIM